ncbi:MAG: pyridoxamine kinase [Ruminococcaceae bacterium]|nr:pyridoxamine kinase [Oscillospiraceae bacterium]
MKRVVTVQDVSCVGKCSLTVALPIISAAGVECAVVPTAVLSTHTAFPKFTFCDLTDEIEPIANTWKELDITFDAIYTGYLGSHRQLSLVGKLIDDFKESGTLVVIDPVMADNGVLYKGFTPEFAAAMAKLCAKADLIVPNLTEASFMLGIEYNPDYDEEYIRDVLKRLTGLGCPRAAITGITLKKGEIGVYYYDRETDSYYSYFNELLPVRYHGTGDIYASATVGALMRGLSYEDSLALATDFTLECIKYTLHDENRRFYGVNFEEALPFYISRIPTTAL